MRILAGLDVGFMTGSIKRLRAVAVATVLGIGAIMSSAEAAPILQQISPNPTTYTLDVDWRLFVGTYPNADVTAALAAPSGALGCDAGDFAGFSAGTIALILRGTCSFSEKVVNAEAAGAVGAIIYNHLDGQLNVSIGATEVGIMPVFTTQALGQELLALLGQGDVVMRIDLTRVPEPAPIALVVFGLLGLALIRRGASR